MHPKSRDLTSLRCVSLGTCFVSAMALDIMKHFSAGTNACEDAFPNLFLHHMILIKHSKVIDIVINLARISLWKQLNITYSSIQNNEEMNTQYRKS